MLVLLVASVHIGYGRRLWYPCFVALAGVQTHDEVVARLGPIHRSALQAAVSELGSKYPPERLRLIGLKHERVLESGCRARTAGDGFTRIPSWRRAVDQVPSYARETIQVPEGIYRLTGFNPNSSYHLSVRVDYPNRDDRGAAAAEGRQRLGGDIFIHGKAVSIGCLAMGDRAIEELYLLLADTGLSNATLVLSPSTEPESAKWRASLVEPRLERIRTELSVVRGVSTIPVGRAGRSAPQ